jgi:hypothetical protein
MQRHLLDEQNLVDRPAERHLLSATMKTAIILVVGKRVGKAV